jgi:hypothetical protein
MPLDPIASAVIVRLVHELSTELDLHHADEEMPFLHTTMEALFEAASLLKQNHIELPEPFLHLQKRVEPFGTGSGCRH